MHTTTTLSTQVKSRTPSKNQQSSTVYKHTILSLQNDMDWKNRTFSKVIHSKGVELISTALGTTILRPNALFFAGVFAFSATTIAYIVAKNSGYELSGSETVLTLIIGLCIGTLYDFLKIIFSGHRK